MTMIPTFFDQLLYATALHTCSCLRALTFISHHNLWYCCLTNEEPEAHGASPYPESQSLCSQICFKQGLMRGIWVVLLY